MIGENSATSAYHFNTPAPVFHTAPPNTRILWPLVLI